MNYYELIYYTLHWAQRREKRNNGSFSMSALIISGMQSIIILSILAVIDIVAGKNIAMITKNQHIIIFTAIIILNHIYIYTGSRRAKILSALDDFDRVQVKKYYRILVYIVIAILVTFGIAAYWRGQVLGLLD